MDDTPTWVRGASGSHGTEPGGPLVTLDFACNEAVLLSTATGPGIHTKIIQHYPLYKVHPRFGSKVFEVRVGPS